MTILNTEVSSSCDHFTGNSVVITRISSKNYVTKRNRKTVAYRRVARFINIRTDSRIPPPSPNDQPPRVGRVASRGGGGG